MYVILRESAKAIDPKDPENGMLFGEVQNKTDMQPLCVE